MRAHRLQTSGNTSTLRSPARPTHQRCHGVVAARMLAGNTEIKHNHDLGGGWVRGCLIRIMAHLSAEGTPPNTCSSMAFSSVSIRHLRGVLFGHSQACSHAFEAPSRALSWTVPGSHSGRLGAGAQVS